MQDKRNFLLQPQSSSRDENVSNQYGLMKQENEKLLAENIALKKRLEKEEFYHQNLYKQWSELNASVIDKDRELEELRSARNPKLKVYRYAFYVLLIIMVLLAVFNYYSFTKSGRKNSASLQTASPENNTDSQTISYATAHQGSTSDSANKTSHKKDAKQPTEVKSTPARSLQVNSSVNSDKTIVTKAPAKYLVKTKSYFYNEADPNTKRNTFLLPWNDAYGILTALDDKNGFIYVVFTNRARRTSKGWIRKSDLELLK